MVLPEVADVLNVNQSSQKASRYLNRAQEELLNQERWVGTTIKYRICSDSGFITWPRELGTIEAMKIGDAPALLKNQWFEFLEYGADTRSHYYGGLWSEGFNLFGGSRNSVAVDQAEAISFADVCANGNAKKLKVYAQATEAANARILLQFYDGTGNYVRSNDPAEGWVDGEFVAINATTPQTTINPVTAWVGVQKPITNDAVRITELDTVTGLERLLAVYAPNEVSPSYRRTHIRQFGCGRGTHRKTSVTVIGKQRFIPALNPRDYLCLQSRGAIIVKAKAIYLRDNNNLQESMALDAISTDLLDKELGAWIGSGGTQTVGVNMVFGASNHQNYI
jgi:hypothetical protein